MVVSSFGLNELRSIAASGDPAATRRVAQEFESLIVSEMLRFASKPLAGSHPLDGGSAGRMAREQLFSELARGVSRGRGLGLARELEQQLQASGEHMHMCRTGQNDVSVRIRTYNAARDFKGGDAVCSRSVSKSVSAASVVITVTSSLCARACLT